MGLGWGCNHVSGSCTHAVCYATATLVCESNFRFFMYSWYAAGVFMCTHGTLLVCHVQVGVGLGWGCNPVSGSCTHAVCYATATLVCELSVLYVFMANRVKWIRCKLQVIVIFSARFGEKNWRLDMVKTFNDQLHLKTWYAVYFWKKHILYGKTQ